MITLGDNEFNAQFGLVQLQLGMYNLPLILLVCVLLRMISLKVDRRRARGENGTTVRILGHDQSCMIGPVAHMWMGKR